MRIYIAMISFACLCIGCRSKEIWNRWDLCTHNKPLLRIASTDIREHVLRLESELDNSRLVIKNGYMTDEDHFKLDYEPFPGHAIATYYTEEVDEDYRLAIEYEVRNADVYIVRAILLLQTHEWPTDWSWDCDCHPQEKISHFDHPLYCNAVLSLRDKSQFQPSGKTIEVELGINYMALPYFVRDRLSKQWEIIVNAKAKR